MKAKQKQKLIMSISILIFIALTFLLIRIIGIYYYVFKEYKSIATKDPGILLQIESTETLIYPPEEKDLENFQKISVDFFQLAIPSGNYTINKFNIATPFYDIGLSDNEIEHITINFPKKRVVNIAELSFPYQDLYEQIAKKGHLLGRNSKDKLDIYSILYYIFSVKYNIGNYRLKAYIYPENLDKLTLIKTSKYFGFQLNYKPESFGKNYKVLRFLLFDSYNSYEIFYYLKSDSYQAEQNALISISQFQAISQEVRTLDENQNDISPTATPENDTEKIPPEKEITTTPTAVNNEATPVTKEKETKQ